MAASAADAGAAAAAAAAQTTAAAAAATSTADQGKGGDQAAAAAATTAANQDWFYADGVKGTGARPEFFKADKYKTLAEQARAYGEAEKKIGELTTQLKGVKPAEAPAEYKMPDAAELGGDFEWKTDDPILTKAFEVAKKHKLSQETFAELAKEVMVPIIRNYELIDIADEKARMGERADERLTGLLDWSKRNLSEDQFAAVNAVLGKWSRPHEVFGALETLLAATRQPGVGKPGEDVRTGVSTVEEINRKYRTPDATTKKALIDTPEGLAKYREELKAVVGTGDHVEIVGKR